MNELIKTVMKDLDHADTDFNCLKRAGIEVSDNCTEEFLYHLTRCKQVLINIETGGEANVCS